MEINDNRALNPDPPGETYELVSRLLLNAAARAAGMRFEADADVSYRTLQGPGAPDSGAPPTDNGIGLKAEKLDQVTKYYLTGSWRRQDAVSAQLADSGVILAQGDINTFGLGAGVIRQLSPIDTVTWSAHWKSVDFTGTVLATPYTDAIVAAAWARRISPTADLIASTQFEWLSRYAPISSETFFVRSTLGLESRLSPQLTFRGSMGGGLQQSNRDDVSEPPSPQPPDARGSWLVDVALIYRPMQTTSLSLGALHTIAPNVVGEVQQRTAFRASLHQAINPLSYFALRSEFNQQVSVDGLAYGTADYLRASATYGYKLTPEWEMQLSYRYAGRDDETGLAHSNAVFLSASRDITVLP